VSTAPTPSQVNKAGKTIRAALRGDPVDFPVLVQAFVVLRTHRALHQMPLTKATMGLRSMVKTAGCQDAKISQRLKRVPTIVDKLVREPTLALATMQDIGGCRAVLATIDEVRRVERRLKKRMVRVSDYIAAPRASGYRGVHVIVEYDGRNIEVQLRTNVMHEWAVTIERLTGELREDLKSGRGPQQVLEFMRLASEAMAVEESGEAVGQDLLHRFYAARERAVPFLEGGQQ
jgi:putative GTP pyrophosphokinase